MYICMSLKNYDEICALAGVFIDRITVYMVYFIFYGFFMPLAGG